MKSHSLGCGEGQVSAHFLYRDAVLHAAGQQDQVWRLHPLVAPHDVLLNLLQRSSELVNQLQCLAVGEVLLHVVAQRNLGRTQEAIRGRRAKNRILISQFHMAEAMNSGQEELNVQTKRLWLRW